jgi:hypothetical protein
VVWGEFLRELWLAEERGKILVYNPVSKFAELDRKVRRPVITYFSQPLWDLPFLSRLELVDGFIHVMHSIARDGYEVLVRLHPRESPRTFIRRWHELCGSIPKNVTFSQGEPLLEVLERTGVALMILSTVMLDCMARGIPIVIPGWLDMQMRPALSQVHGIYRAEDFSDIRERLVRWLEEPSHIPERTSRYFVREPGEGKEEFSAAIAKLVSG